MLYTLKNLSLNFKESINKSLFNLESFNYNWFNNGQQ